MKFLLLFDFFYILFYNQNLLIISFYSFINKNFIKYLINNFIYFLLYFLYNKFANNNKLSYLKYINLEIFYYFIYI